MRKFIFTIIILAFLLPCFALAEEPPKPDDGVEVPVIMYHLITEKSKYIGKYGVTPKEIAADLAYLRDNDYTTVFMSQLIDFVESGTPLPAKPIVLTFDDGNFSDYNYLYPLLKEYNARAVLAIIGKATDECTKMFAETPTAVFPNLTWAQAKELHESGHFEIQSHGYDMHGRGGSGEKRSESLEQYHARLHDDLQKLQNLCAQHIGFTPTTFVYPLGIIGKDSRIVIEGIGMKASLSCQEGINTLRQGEADALFKMHRYNRPSGTTVEKLLQKMEKQKTKS